MRKIFLALLCISFIMVICSFQIDDSLESKQRGYIPKEGFIPDEETAIKIAETILVPIYGERVLKKRPFKAKLENGVWYIEGTLPDEYMMGGIPYVEIQKSDCRILRVIHTK